MLYHYAYDENNELVEINDVNKATHLGKRFRCLGCGGTMIARIGEHNEAHFAHLQSNIACGGESYLHKLTKKRLLDAWNDRTGSFVCDIDKAIVCDKNGNCLFQRENHLKKCQTARTEQIKLFDWYETIAEEAPVNDKIADLLLTSQRHPERPPLALEVHCKHAVDEAKKATGLKMIEFDIKDENDIKAVIENGFPSKGEIAKRLNIKHWNFTKKEKIERLRKRVEKHPEYFRFKFYRSGAARIESVNTYTVSCNQSVFPENVHVDKYSLIELDIYIHDEDYNNYLRYGLVKCQEMGIALKNCHLCRFAITGMPDECGLFCKAYKKYGTPRNPNQKEANTCFKFWLNESLIAEDKERLAMARVEIIKDDR